MLKLKSSGASRFWKTCQLLQLLESLCRKKHTVIIRVLDGGDGSTRGGRFERSIESGDLFPDDARERSGEGVAGCIVASI